MVLAVTKKLQDIQKGGYMNEAQRKWTERKCRELDDYFCTHFPLTDKHAEEVVAWVGKIIDQAKGSKDDCRAEVRQALFEVLEKWERKLNEKG